jgi:outer membrane protein assembly factor BamB
MRIPDLTSRRAAGARNRLCSRLPALCLCAAGFLLPAAAAQQNLYAPETSGGRSSEHNRPPEVYVEPAIAWSGPLPQIELQLAATCALRGEPSAGPVWLEGSRMAVISEDTEAGAHWLQVCGLNSTSPLWTVGFPGPAAGSPVAGEGRIYLALASGQVRAHALDTGGEIWTSVVGESLSGLALLGESLAAGAGSRLFALDPADGRVRFAADLGAVARMPPAPCAGAWVASLESGSVMAMNPADGRKIWARALHGPPAPPACGDRTVVVGTSGRELVALSGRRGRRLWRQRLGGAVDSRPLLYGSAVFAGALDGRVYGLKLGNGHRAWSTGVGERVRRAPALVRGLLVVASAGDTRLSVLHPPTGTHLLEAEAPPEAAGWVGAPASHGELLALAVDRRNSPDGVLIVYRVVDSAGPTPAGAGR